MQNTSLTLTSRAAVIESLGFPTPKGTHGLHSIAHLFKQPESRCGVYLLVLPNEQFYIGQSIQVVRRFSQHLKFFKEIIGFTFMPTPRAQLDAREKTVIFAAETVNLPLLNVVHATHDECESDLDALLSTVQLNQWLKSPTTENQRDHNTLAITLEPNPRHEINLDKLRRHPLGGLAQLQLYLYLESAIPYPRLTEYSFWSASCLPSTNASTFPRLLCVNASVMELFSIGYAKGAGEQNVSWGFINVASDVLYEHFDSQRAFEQLFPHVNVDSTHYRDGGQHQVALRTWQQDDMFALLQNPAVMKAAATLAIRLMKKRSNIYYKYHCPPLVDAALGFREIPQEHVHAAIKAALA